MPEPWWCDTHKEVLPSTRAAARHLIEEHDDCPRCGPYTKKHQPTLRLGACRCRCHEPQPSPDAASTPPQ